MAGPQLDLLPSGTKHSATGDHRIDLLLTIPRVIVLRSLSPRRQLKLIDPKARDPELISQRTKDTMRRLHITRMNNLVRTHYSLLSVCLRLVNRTYRA